MDKPVLVAREDMTKEIADAIYRSRLPMFVVEPVLEKLLAEVRVAVQQEYIKDKEEYEKRLKEEVKEDGD